MRMRAFILIPMVLICAAQEQQARTTVSLDLGWRHHLGAVSGQCSPNQTFPVNYTACQMDGLTGVNVTTASACEAACCSSVCEVFQFWTGDPKSQPMLCWIGQIAPCNSNDSNWLSFGTNATSPSAPAVALPSYDDSLWEVIDLPHDPRVEGTFDPTADKGQAFLRANVSVYRKHLVFPSAWGGSHIRLVIEGAFSVSQWFFNGQWLQTKNYGYTSVVLPLDSLASSINWDGQNVLAALVDATVETGWWYEGSGLYRHAYLLVTSPVHVQQDGVFAPAYLMGQYHARAMPGDGLTVDMAYMDLHTTVENTGVAGVTGPVTVAWDLLDVSGSKAINTTFASIKQLNGSSVQTVTVPQVPVYTPELWSIPRPYLYTLVTSISVGGSIVDTVNTSIGFRSVAWDGEQGLFINQQPVKMRGFCNHNSFTSFGVGVPDRVNLLRVQQVRGLGGNAWRTSHNPPAPALLDLFDRLGIVALDENRLFDSNAQYYQNMRELVLRDRWHASVIWWSFCNEVGCSAGGTEPTLDFKTIAYELDGSRAVTGNVCTGWSAECNYVPGQLNNMSVLLDVQGFSHVDTSVFQGFHNLAPEKPIAATECCSCETMRGEDADLPHNSSLVFYSNFNQPCLGQQTQWSNGLQYVSGSFVWTAHDYMGEPDNWPHISSSFGSYDLAGFPKAPVWWYRSWWMGNVSVQDAGRPPVPGTNDFVHIVESWQPPASGTTRAINVYSNAPYVKLSVNGQTVGPGDGLVSMPAFGWSAFGAVPYSAGTLTATAVAADGSTVLATDSKASWGAPAFIAMTLDVPNPSTGTGAALYLDGSDVALVRATVVDAMGNTCHDSTLNITFAVTAGPGLVYGTGNGDPNNHDPAHSTSRPAYHGLLRGLVRVTLNAVGSSTDRALAALVNVDAGQGPRSSAYMPPGGTPPASITVTASAAGVQAGSLTIPLSVNDADSVLATAAASVAAAYIGA